MQPGSPLKFVRASFTGAKLTIVKLLVGFVRVKFIALQFGASGTGLLAQATQLSVFGVSLGSLSMAVGIINRLNDPLVISSPDRRQKILSTAFTTQCLVCVPVLAAALLATTTIGHWVFGPLATPGMVLAVFLSVPLSAITAGYLEGILFGFGRYDWYVRASCIAAIGSLIAFIPLGYFWGLGGAFWALLISALLYFFCFTFYVSKLLPLREVFSFGLDRVEGLNLLRFSAVMTLAGLATYGSSILIRRKILGTLGADAAGIVQVPIALSAYFTPFLTNAFWGRLHPAVAKTQGESDACTELVSVLPITAVITTALILSLLVGREFFVHLAYSPAFVGAITLIPLQLTADFFYLIAFCFSVYFLARSKLRIYLIGWILYFSIVVGGTFVLLPSLGLKAVPVAYGFSGLLFVLASLVWLSRKIEGIPFRRLLGVLFGCMALILLQDWVLAEAAPFWVRFLIPGALMLGLLKRYGKTIFSELSILS